jgi:hypothetical protein
MVTGLLLLQPLLLRLLLPALNERPVVPIGRFCSPETQPSRKLALPHVDESHLLLFRPQRAPFSLIDTRSALPPQPQSWRAAQGARQGVLRGGEVQRAIRYRPPLLALVRAWRQLAEGAQQWRQPSGREGAEDSIRHGASGHDFWRNSPPRRGSPCASFNSHR